MSSAEPRTFFGKAEAVTRGELTPTEEVVCPLCGIAPTPFAVDFQGFTSMPLRRMRDSNSSLRGSRSTSSPAKFIPTTTCQNAARRIGDRARRFQTFSQQLANIERLVGGRKSILDIGCGNGAFLDLAREAGWQIAGVDIKLAEDARDLDCPLWEGRLQDIDFGSNTFNVVRLNHVLEHTQDPLAELRICRQLIDPGGVLFISVPNIAGLSPRLKSLQSRLHLKSHRWRHYAAMHHLFFFSPATLRALVERAGFRVLEWKHAGPEQERSERAGRNAL
jgi:2-polyprenyl-3-methyl-5-hydroxy-6-metoxy-1,4-benzoquinol methylase